jgi:hypothetical protein
MSIIGVGSTPAILLMMVARMVVGVGLCGMKAHVMPVEGLLWLLWLLVTRARTTQAIRDGGRAGDIG